MREEIREMTIDDYPAVYALWQATEGIGLSQADSKENIARYLANNPGMSFCAWDGESLVGAVLCGTDSRRGFLHHLAVEKGHRRAGIGRLLVERCTAALKEKGLTKCHLFVFQDNQEAIEFWKHCGWIQRKELILMSKGQ
jgi:ribosomal protein S18 acetylase RimI-like enzyme